MERDEDETDIEAAYRYLSRPMHHRLAGKTPDREGLRKLLVEAYQRRADLQAAIANAEFVFNSSK